MLSKLFFHILFVAMLMLTSVGFGCQEYPEENYKQYFEGCRTKPIAFVQWGYAYVVELNSVQAITSDHNTLKARVYEVKLDGDNTGKVLPNIINVYASYDKINDRFQIGFLKDNTHRAPAELHTFTKLHIGASTAEAGMLFHTGCVLWEGYHQKPFFEGNKRLKPVGESGAPMMIPVNDNTRFSRLDPDTAIVNMMKPTGSEFYTIYFTPDYFIVKDAHAEREEVEKKLKEEIGVKQYYANNPRTALVKTYMGIY